MGFVEAALRLRLGARPPISIDDAAPPAPGWWFLMTDADSVSYSLAEAIRTVWEQEATE